MSGDKPVDSIKLPDPAVDGKVSVEKTLLLRRSVREYGSEPLTLGNISQLLWAAQGITGKGGYRTAPSAGALYPLEIYIAAGKVTGLDPGIYNYIPQEHMLRKIRSGDKRTELCRASLNQSSVCNAQAVIAVAAVYKRTTGKYGERGIRYVHMEVGHAAQNVCLQAVSLGLNTVIIGAFNDDDIGKILGLGNGEYPLSLIPVGK